MTSGNLQLSSHVRSHEPLISIFFGVIDGLTGLAGSRAVGAELLFVLRAGAWGQDLRLDPGERMVGDDGTILALKDLVAWGVSRRTSGDVGDCIWDIGWKGSRCEDACRLQGMENGHARSGKSGEICGEKLGPSGVKAWRSTRYSSDHRRTNKYRDILFFRKSGMSANFGSYGHGHHSCL